MQQPCRKRTSLHTYAENSVPKRQKKFSNESSPSEGAAAVANIDRISGLPDLLLCRILSFLPTKDAVASSILSTRWEFLWTKVSNFDVDDRERKWRTNRCTNRSSFEPMVDRVLLLSGATSIKKFSLSCSFINASETHVDNWIRAAISREVEHLDLYLYYYHLPGIQLPRALFISKTLVTLKLGGYGIMINGMVNYSSCGTRRSCSSGVCFPCLKTLHLNLVTYQNGEAASAFISSCSVLENLWINKGRDDNVLCLNISAPALKHLGISFPCMKKFQTCSYKLEINAPALCYLELSDFLCVDFHVQNLSRLVEAGICLYDDSPGFDELYTASVIRLLKSICNVKFLSLNNRTLLKALVYEGNPSAKTRFQNLTKLTLQLSDWDCSELKAILLVAENLETLHVIGFLSSWCEPEEAPSCLSSLTTLSFSFRAVEFEVDMVKYFRRTPKS